MVDSVDFSTRSRMMAGIRGKNTQPELKVRSALHRRGLRFRLHARNLPGHPDLVFPARRAVVFVHGCFWHRHPGCHWCTDPGTRQDFWKQKFASNVARDRAQRAQLLEQGWRVGVVWECILKGSQFQSSMDELVAWLDSNTSSFETKVARPKRIPVSGESR
jgi:DNA mismatch endonuclease, patch repair protein